MLSQSAGDQVKLMGAKNDLVDRLRDSAYFEPIHTVLDELLRPEAFIGRSVELVTAAAAIYYRGTLQKHQMHVYTRSCLSVSVF